VFKPHPSVFQTW